MCNVDEFCEVYLNEGVLVMTISIKKGMRRSLSFIVILCLVLSPTSIFATESAGSFNNPDQTALLDEIVRIEARLYDLNEQKQGYMDRIADLNSQKAELVDKIDNFVELPPVYTPEPPPEYTPQLPEYSPEQDSAPEVVLPEQTPPVECGAQADYESSNYYELKTDTEFMVECEFYVPDYCELEAHHNAYIPADEDFDVESYDVQSNDKSTETSLLGSIVNFFITPVFAFEYFEEELETEIEITATSMTLEELKEELAQVESLLASYNNRLDNLISQISQQEVILGILQNALLFGAQTSTNVRIQKTANVIIVQEGDEFYYTITITNDGSSAVDNVLVSVTTMGIGSIVTYPLNSQLVNGLVNVEIGTLAPGQTITFTMTATANPVTTINRHYSITNVASLNINGIPSGVDSTRVTAVSEDAPRLELTKSANRQNVPPGGLIVYTFTVTNSGETPATSVEIHDVLRELQFVSARSLEDPNRANFQMAGNTFIMTLANLGVNETYKFELTARVTRTQPGLIRNYASVIFCGKYLHHVTEVVNVTVDQRQPGVDDGIDDSWIGDNIIQQPQPEPQPDVIIGDIDAILREEDELITAIIEPQVPLDAWEDDEDIVDIARAVPVSDVPVTDATGSGLAMMLLSLLALALLGRKRNTDGLERF